MYTNGVRLATIQRICEMRLTSVHRLFTGARGRGGAGGAARPPRQRLAGQRRASGPGGAGRRVAGQAASARRVVLRQSATVRWRQRNTFDINYGSVHAQGSGQGFEHRQWRLRSCTPQRTPSSALLTSWLDWYRSLSARLLQQYQHSSPSQKRRFAAAWAVSSMVMN